MKPEAYELRRDGAVIARIERESSWSGPMSYDDAEAAAGTVTAPSSPTASKDTVANGVRLTWTASTAVPGPVHRYVVVAVDGDRTTAPSDPSLPAEGRRAAPIITGYEVRRDGVGVALLGGEPPATGQFSYLDVASSAGSVGSVGFPRSLATSSSSPEAVHLTWEVPTSLQGPTHEYTIMALHGTGSSNRSEPSTAVEGRRAAPEVSSYSVERDGALIASIAPTAAVDGRVDYWDFEASAGSVSPPRALTATDTEQELVQLAWTIAEAAPGPVHQYTIHAHWSDDGANARGASAAIEGRRAAQNVTGYEIQRDGEFLDVVSAEAATEGRLNYRDVTAIRGSVRAPLSPAATNSLQETVQLTWMPSAAIPGPTHAYSVTPVLATNRAGRGEWSASAEGRCAAPVISAYEIQRDGSVLTTVGVEAMTGDRMTYWDYEATRGSVGPPRTVVATNALPDLVELVWQAPVSAPGPEHRYSLVALQARSMAERSEASEAALGRRAAPVIAGYEIQRDGKVLDTLRDDAARGDSVIYSDRGAAAGSVAAISSLTATATLQDAVQLTWTRPSTTPGPAHAYSVTALLDALGRERSATSASAEGNRSAPTITGYEIRRDGEALSVLRGALARTESVTYWDAHASAGTVGAPSSLSATQGSLPGIVGLVWRAPPSEPGQSHEYAVAALLGVAEAERGEPSNLASGRRAPPEISGYEFSRDNSRTWQSAGSSLSFDDNHPSPWSMDPKVSVRFDLQRGAVVLGASPNLKSPDSQYRVRAVTAVGRGPDSSPALGFSAQPPPFWYQWQRSSDARDADYSDLPGITGSTWFDQSIPLGISRYYRVVMTDKGSESARSLVSAPAAVQTFGIKSVAAGHGYSCALRSDDRVACWGDNSSGQAPETPSRDSFQSVSAGSQHACGVRVDGKVVCWGDNSSGQAPTEPSSESFLSISTGGLHTCGIRTDRKVVCWGNNAYAMAPKGPSLESFQAISAGHYHTCGIRSDDKVVCWGDNENGAAPAEPSTDSFKSVSAGDDYTCGIRADDRIVCWGDDAVGQAPAEPSHDLFKAVAAGYEQTCAIRNDDRLVCWGSNLFGEAPSEPSADSFKSVSAGRNHSCGIRIDDRMVCWGENGRGLAPRLPPTDSFKSVSAGNQRTCGVRMDDKIVCWGDNTWGGVLPPVTVDSFQSVSTGNLHVCGMRMDETAACWGDNALGQAPPEPFTESHASVAAGAWHACGLRLDGKVHCWGNNGDGQAPSSPSVESFKSVAAGGWHTCGIRFDERVTCWGSNVYGQAPPEPSIDRFKSISAGSLHSCGIRADDKIVCWGNNARGAAPRDPSNDPFQAVSAGGGHTCALRLDGSVKCVGNNDDGQAPDELSLDAYQSVSAGSGHTCGIRADSKVLCWGNNSSGQAPRP